MDKIVKMKEALNQLSAQELKQLLLQTFHQVEAAANGQLAKEELYPFLIEMYDHLLDIRQTRSAAGSLMRAQKRSMWSSATRPLGV